MAGIDGNFAAGLNSGLQNGVRAIFMAPLAREQAQLQSGLMGAQAAKATIDAQTGARDLRLRDDPETLAAVRSLFPGADTLFRIGASPDKLPNSMLELQKLDLNRQAAGAIPVESSGLDRQNRLVSIASGKSYEPFAAVGDTGGVLDKGTGAMAVADPALRAIFADRAANVAAKGNPNLRYDPTRGVVVDMATGTASAPTMAGGGPMPPANNPAAKPLPGVALRMQQDTLADISTLGAINADLGAIQAQLDRGELKLNPISNAVNSAQNYIGLSDQQSRNYASLRATLEKMRNDSLRLNKGVQTEGDAVRAWNELFANLNDAGVVKQRLSEIQAINQRAAEQKGLQNDMMLANFGHDPMDYSTYFAQRPAVGTASGGAGQAPAVSPAQGPSAPATRAIPDAAAAYLRANPGLAAQFDQKYGAGAAARILGL